MGRVGIAAALSAFARFEPVSVALEVDGGCELRRLGQLFVVNFPLFGPRFQVVPGADPGDGAREVVEVEAGRRSSLALALARPSVGPGAVGATSTQQWREKDRYMQNFRLAAEILEKAA